MNSLVELITSSIDNISSPDVHPSQRAPPGLIEGTQTPEMITRHFRNTLIHIQNRKSAAAMRREVGNGDGYGRGDDNEEDEEDEGDGEGEDGEGKGLRGRGRGRGGEDGEGEGRGVDPRWDDVDVVGALLKMGLGRQ